MNEGERQAQSIFDSVREEASKDVQAVRALNQGNEGKGASDFDASLIQTNNFISQEEQIAQRIQDLKELDQNDESDDPENMKMDPDDSDAEEMKEIINYDDQSEEGEDED